MEYVRKYISSKFASGMLSFPRSMPGELIDLYLLQEMKKADLDPAIINAFESTLMWCTKENEKSFSKKQLNRWDSAIIAYVAEDKRETYHSEIYGE